MEQPRDPDLHPHLSTWSVTSETRRGDHDAPIAAATVDDEHQKPIVEVDVYVSPIDGAAVVHVWTYSDEAPVRVTINDSTVFTADA